MKKPNYYANLTKAISSGLEACNILAPSSRTGVTLLQMIKAVARSLCKNSCLLLAFFFILSKILLTILHHEDLPKDPQIFDML